MPGEPDEAAGRVGPGHAEDERHVRHEPVAARRTPRPGPTPPWMSRWWCSTTGGSTGATVDRGADAVGADGTVRSSPRSMAPTLPGRVRPARTSGVPVGEATSPPAPILTRCPARTSTRRPATTSIGPAFEPSARRRAALPARSAVGRAVRPGPAARGADRRCPRRSRPPRRRAAPGARARSHESVSDRRRRP